MKALTIKQPWASMITLGGKNIENRDWFAPRYLIGERIAIHSSKKLDKDELEDGFELWIANGGTVEFWYDKISPFKLGAIIGTVRLVACVDEHSSPWFFGKYGFVGAENVVNLAESITSDIQNELPPPPGYKCADCTFTSKFLSEIQEHCAGTGHGGWDTHDEEEPEPIQPELFSEPGIVIRSINTPLPEDELNQKRTRLADLYQEVLEVKSAKKSADADFNAQITAIDESMQAIARVLKYPTTNQSIKCEWRILTDENARGLYRLDTGEQIEKQPLSQEDYVAEQERVAKLNAEQPASETPQ